MSVLLRQVAAIQASVDARSDIDPALLRHLQKELDPQQVMDSIRESLTEIEGPEEGRLRKTR